VLSQYYTMPHIVLVSKYVFFNPNNWVQSRLRAEFIWPKNVRNFPLKYRFPKNGYYKWSTTRFWSLIYLRVYLYGRVLFRFTAQAWRVAMGCRLVRVHIVWGDWQRVVDIPGWNIIPTVLHGTMKYNREFLL